MKKILFLTVVLIIFNTLTISALNSCDDAKSCANQAYSYFYKAYNASSLEDAKMYARKGMIAASDAEYKSKWDCGCDDAKNAANMAYIYGKKVCEWSNNLSGAKEYLKKAMDSATEITIKLKECGK